MAGLEDLLLFESRVYWRLFALENEAVWPAQPVLLAAGALLVLCLLRGWRPSWRWLGPVLGAAWLWAGWQFVAQRYGAINWAAPTFAWGFYAEAALLAALGLSGRLSVAAGGMRAQAAIALLAAAFWGGRSSHRSTGDRGTRRRCSRSRPIPPPRPRSPCWRWRNAAGGRRY